MKKRIESIDLLRGLIMIIMALDHVRDYFHHDSMVFDPTDLQKTYPLLFFTRWITHICAPLFVFLSGISGFLSGQKKTKKELSLFLLKRGAWLILLEFTIVNFAWFANPAFTRIGFGVLWALGISMVFLALLIFLPRKIILILGLLVLAGHNLLDSVSVAGNGLNSFFWALCHERHAFVLGEFRIAVLYPALPWIALMAVGYCLGPIFSPSYPAARRKQLLLGSALVCISLFIVLRLINVYGDPTPWTKQAERIFTFLSFMNMQKYPPSLDYLLITVGLGLLFLTFAEKKPGPVGEKIMVYGRVPMFFYLVHLYAIHLLAIFAALYQGYDWTQMVELPALPPFTPWLKDYGFNLGITYLIWALLIVMLYPFCKWYDRYKSTHKNKRWLSYL